MNWCKNECKVCQWGAHPNDTFWVRENLIFRMCEKIEKSARICDVIDILQSTLKICMEDERWIGGVAGGPGRAVDVSVRSGEAHKGRL